MDINEKAKMYAEGKALDAITSAIEKAYAEGYKDGYKDCIAKAGIEPPVEIVDGITYVDLGLPSGKKWSFAYLKFNGSSKNLTYEEASKYNIPTKDDYLELVKSCEMIPKKNWDNKVYIWDFLGKTNGKFIEIYKTYADTASSTKEYESFVFWLRDNNPEGDERLCADGSSKDLLGKVCMGYKLPIMLVK